MSTNNSRQAYEDCYEVMDQALQAEDGIRIGFDSDGEAKHYRMRMNYARTLDQKFNMNRYEGTDPRRGKSDYDVLSIRVRSTQGMHWVYIEKRKKPTVIEELKPGEGADAKPIRQVISHRRF